MKCSCDAVCRKLSISIPERYVHIEADVWTRHDLTLECVAMDIYDAGKRKEPGGVQHRARRISGRA
jgi:hypothetical protein